MYKSTTLGYPLVGLVCQVEVLIKDPPANSMASFHFTSAMLKEGTTFTFSSWVCIANGLGGFNSHLVSPKEPKVPAAN
jgi:hypothetical protein